MAQEKSNYDTAVTEIKADLQKMANNEIDLQEAINLFEVNLDKINVLKNQLAEYKLKVKKVLEANKIEDFEA